jgi:hypothetical protein
MARRGHDESSCIVHLSVCSSPQWIHKCEFGWCAEQGQGWTVQALQEHIETNYLQAIATAYAYAFTSNDPFVCVAALRLGASVAPVPV